MRILYDNAIDRATIAASASAGVLTPERMRTDEKAEVWRSTGTAATLTLTWAQGERVDLVGGAFMNASSGQQWRVRGYTQAGDADPIIDETHFVVPAAPFGSTVWGVPPLGANSFAYGASATGAAYLATSVVLRKLVIDIVDQSNVAGYVEIGKLFCGRVWQPEESADRAASLSVQSNTVQSRSDAGSLRRDAGAKWRKLALSLSWLSPLDREQLFNIAYNNGLERSLFISLYPQDADPVLEQAHQLWGCLVASPQMALTNYLRYASALDFEET